MLSVDPIRKLAAGLEKCFNPGGEVVLVKIVALVDLCESSVRAYYVTPLTSPNALRRTGDRSFHDELRGDTQTVASDRRHRHPNLWFDIHAPGGYAAPENMRRTPRLILST